MIRGILPALLSLILAARPSVAQPEGGITEIIQAVDRNERLESSRSTGKQIITTSSGSERTLEMEMYTKDQNDKQLTVYTGPARVRGDKILMLDDGDDIWFYTPKTDRVRHLASHARRQKVQGSDFAYEDMAAGNWEEDFTHSLSGHETIDGNECWHITSVPTPEGPGYARLESWVDKQTYVPIRVDYYEEDGILKRLTMSDIEEFDGHWVPKTMHMENLRDGGETTIVLEEMEVNIDLDDGMFTTNYLKRR